MIEDGIYAIRIDDELMVKRIQRLANGDTTLISDNAAHEEQTIPGNRAETLKIIGRAVWGGRKL